MKRRAELVDELAPYAVDDVSGHPWAAWAEAEAQDEGPAAGRGQPVERQQGPVLGAAAARARGRGDATTTWRAPGSGTRPSCERWRPDREPAVLHLRPARPPRTLRPGRDPGRLASGSVRPGPRPDRRRPRAPCTRSCCSPRRRLREHDVHASPSCTAPTRSACTCWCPADAEHNRLIEALDEIALGRLRDALATTTTRRRRRPSSRPCTRSTPRSTCSTAAGLEAHGLGHRLDPVRPRWRPPARRLRRDHRRDPAAPGDEALHRDWASRLRDELALPVLHVVSGTDRVVS